jgi:hypothetical protein
MSLKVRLLLIRRVGIGIGAALLTYGVLKGWPYGHLPTAVCGAFVLGLFGPGVHCDSDGD